MTSQAKKKILRGFGLVAAVFVVYIVAEIVLNARQASQIDAVHEPGQTTSHLVKIPRGFSASVPNWKVEEHVETPGATFFGPPDGDRPFSEMIGVYFYRAADPARGARDHLFYQSSRSSGPLMPLPISVSGLKEVVVNRIEPDVHTGEHLLTTRTVVVIVPDGFFSLEHTYATDAVPSPAFDEMLRTFRPGKTRMLHPGT